VLADVAELRHECSEGPVKRAFATLLRHKAVIAEFSLLGAGLSVAIASWNHQRTIVDWLARQNSAVESASSIVTIIVVSAASVASYFRFFRGRTLAVRAELAIEISVHDTPAGYRVHAFALRAKNVGNSTIWRPNPTVGMRIHGPLEVVEDLPRELTEWWKWWELDHQTSLIDAGETVTFFALQQIPDRAWAVTYYASLHADSGDVWYLAKTVTNAPLVQCDS
jgi:hypothetical protein